jgi:hypothetical protein
MRPEVPGRGGRGPGAAAVGSGVWACAAHADGALAEGARALKSSFKSLQLKVSCKCCIRMGFRRRGCHSLCDLLPAQPASCCSSRAGEQCRHTHRGEVGDALFWWVTAAGVQRGLQPHRRAPSGVRRHRPLHQGRFQMPWMACLSTLFLGGGARLIWRAHACGARRCGTWAAASAPQRSCATAASTRCAAARTAPRS